MLPLPHEDSAMLKAIAELEPAGCTSGLDATAAGPAGAPTGGQWAGTWVAKQRRQEVRSAHCWRCRSLENSRSQATPGIDRSFAGCWWNMPHPACISQHATSICSDHPELRRLGASSASTAMEWLPHSMDMCGPLVRYPFVMPFPAGVACMMMPLMANACCNACCNACWPCR